MGVLLEDCWRAAEQVFGVSRIEMLRGSRKAEVVMARRAAAWLAVRKAELPISTVARRMETSRSAVYHRVHEWERLEVDSNRDRHEAILRAYDRNARRVPRPS